MTDAQGHSVGYRGDAADVGITTGSRIATLLVPTVPTRSLSFATPSASASASGLPLPLRLPLSGLLMGECEWLGMASSSGSDVRVLGMVLLPVLGSLLVLLVVSLLLQWVHRAAVSAYQAQASISSPTSPSLRSSPST